MNKKGQIFENLKGLGVGVLALCITLAIVFVILAQVKANSTVAADGNATSAVATLTTAAAGIPGWVPLVILAFVGAILLGLVKLFR